MHAQHPNITSKDGDSLIHRPTLFWFSRASCFLGFAFLIASTSLSSDAEPLDPSLWVALTALVCVLAGLVLSRFCMPKPLEPIVEVPMKHTAWFMFLIIVSPFVLRWFSWDGPQIVVLAAIAIFTGWWGSYYPVARHEAIGAQYSQAPTGS